MKKLLNVAGLAAGLVVGGLAVFGWARSEEGVLLRVVDARSGEPLSGAEVRFLDPKTLETTRWLWGGASQMCSPRSERVDALGSHHRTDEVGELRLPAFSKTAYVSAAHDGLYDLERVRSDREEPVVLKLVPDVTVRVRVLDSGGQPCAGVPVALRRYPGASASGPAGLEVGSTGSQSTSVVIGGSSGPRNLGAVDSIGPEGIAEFRHVQEIVGERKPDERLAFAIGSLIAEPDEVELEADGWPEEPLVLQLPETGELEVHVVDVNGEPLVDPELTVSLRFAYRKIEGDRMVVSSPRGTAVENEVAAPEGRALFRHVGLGLELHGSWYRRWLSPSLSVEGNGPTKAGERVTLTVKCPVADHVLKGRVHNEAGRNFAETEIQCGMAFVGSRGPTAAGYDTVETDEHGAFEVLCGPGPGDAWEELQFKVLYTDRSSDDYVASTGFSFTRDDLMKPGVTDLGDIVLMPPAVLAAGVVVDSKGEPRPGMTVRVELQQFTGPAPADPTGERPFRWQRSQLYGRGDEKGNFEILGVFDGEKLRLSCLTGRGYQGRLVVSPGATGLRIVVP